MQPRQNSKLLAYADALAASREIVKRAKAHTLRRAERLRQERREIGERAAALLDRPPRPAG